MACSIPPVYLHLQPYSEFARTFQSLFRFLLSPETPLLMALTILATGIGLSLQSYEPRQIVVPPEGDLELEDQSQAIKRHRIGQVVLAVTSLSLFFQGVTTGVIGRGVNQVVFGLEHAFTTFRQFAMLAAVMVVYSSRLQLRLRLGKAALDHVMFALALVGYLLIGSRNSLLAMVLIVFILKQPRKPTKARNIFLAIVIGTLLFSWIARYRSADPGKQEAPFTLISVWDAFVTDLSSVSGTTGVVHSLVPAVEPFTLGGTMAAEVVRLLPSPIAIALFGQPTTTGSFKFRQLLQFENPDNGLGFSLPAAGYLDLGLFGLIGIMILCGWFLAWLWHRFDPYRAEVSKLAYLVVAANFPMFLRSDLLALLKGSLYPLAMLWLMIQIADYGKRRDQRHKRIDRSSHGLPEPGIKSVGGLRGNSIGDPVRRPG